MYFMHTLLVKSGILRPLPPRWVQKKLIEYNAVWMYEPHLYWFRVFFENGDWSFLGRNYPEKWIFMVAMAKECRGTEKRQFSYEDLMRMKDEMEQVRG